MKRITGIGSYGYPLKNSAHKKEANSKKLAPFKKMH